MNHAVGVCGGSLFLQIASRVRRMNIQGFRHTVNWWTKFSTKSNVYRPISLSVGPIHMPCRVGLLANDNAHFASTLSTNALTILIARGVTMPSPQMKRARKYLDWRCMYSTGKAQSKVKLGPAMYPYFFRHYYLRPLDMRPCNNNNNSNRILLVIDNA